MSSKSRTLLNIWDATSQYRVGSSRHMSRPRCGACYAPGNEGVAVATTFGRLRNLVTGAVTETKWLTGAASVKYIDHFNDGLIKRLTTEERLPNTMMPFMLKNISYKEENEVRAVIIARRRRSMKSQERDLMCH
jgi:hypothetical protein